jgi:hypothetical protein
MLLPSPSREGKEGKREKEEKKGKKLVRNLASP